MTKNDLMILKTMFKEWVDLASRNDDYGDTLQLLDRHTKRLQYMITWTTNNTIFGREESEKE